MRLKYASLLDENADVVDEFQISWLVPRTGSVGALQPPTTILLDITPVIVTPPTPPATQPILIPDPYLTACCNVSESAVSPASSAYSALKSDALFASSPDPNTCDSEESTRSYHSASSAYSVLGSVGDLVPVTASRHQDSQLSGIHPLRKEIRIETLGQIFFLNLPFKLFFARN